MGCVIKRPSNGWNFVTANVTNSVLVTDLGGNIEYCSFTLDAPSNLVTIASSSEVNLTWTSNSGGSETGFSIERSLDGVVFVQIATVGTGISVYSDIGLTGGNIYYYRVRALGNIPSAYSNISSAYVFENQEALDWVDLMSNPTLDQQQRIDTLVGSEKSDGNWGLLDDFWLLDLGSTNSKIGVNGHNITIGGLSSEIDFTSQGIYRNTESNNDSWVDTNFDLGVDGVNFQQNSAFAGGYIYFGVENQVVANTVGFYGVQDGVAVTSLACRDTGLGNSGFNSNNIGGIQPQLPISDRVLMFSREASNEFKWYVDGVDSTTTSSTSKTPPTGYNVYLMGINYSGVAGNGFGFGLSSFIIGGGASFDYAAHNTNIRNYLGV